MLSTLASLLGDFSSEPFLGLYFDPTGRKFVIPSDPSETKYFRSADT